MTVRIVTDSTCDLPADIAADYGISVVPAYINIGDESFLDGVELSRRSFYERLPDFESPPKTAAPASGAFAETYKGLAAEGTTEILSIHVAATLSAVVNAARLGAEAADQIKVTVFDSQQLTMGLGLMVIAAAESAAAGRSIVEITTMLKEYVGRTYVMALLDTLEYLRRSGRVNWALYGLGTLLQMKPLLSVHRGEVFIPERVRTYGKARKRLREMIAELGPLQHAALLHTCRHDDVEGFQQELQHVLTGSRVYPAVEVTPAIGAHIGPGAIGIACIVAAQGDPSS